MMRASFLAGMALVAALPATAAADNTPAGPATLKPGSVPVLCPAISGGPGVMVAWEVQVGDGGQGGMVRPVFGDVMGDRVELPPQAGTYRFTAPHLYRDAYVCGPDTVGLIQETGGHAVL